MTTIFQTELVFKLIEKFEADSLSSFEDDYLKKVISCSMLIQQYLKTRNKTSEVFITRYYYKLIKKKQHTFSLKEKSAHILFKMEIEKFFSFFSIKIDQKIPKIYSHFEQLKALADAWNFSLQRNRSSVFEFLYQFAQQIYGIPVQHIMEVFELICSSWRPILSPLAALTVKRFDLGEIENYFFGKKPESLFSTHFIPEADRLFCITNPQFGNHLFLPKGRDFDLFETAQVVHEFQHIQDYSLDYSPFLLEKSALNAERVFLNILGTGKRGKFCFLESNLFYPLLLLKWELDVILSGDLDKYNFHKICYLHGMDTINLSPLFDWKAPFQMMTYCAAALELEPNWKSFFAEKKSQVLAEW